LDWLATFARNWVLKRLHDEYEAELDKLARPLLANDCVVVLFDGLDEARSEIREDCVRAINAFRKDHGVIGIVVSCRTRVFEQLKTKLQLGAGAGAVEIEPLTDE